MRTTPTVILSLCLCWVFMVGSGCQEELPVTDPNGGYIAFQTALLSGDADELWAALSDDTQSLFVEGWAAIVASRMLVQQLDQSDRAEAFRSAGLNVLQRVDSPQSLFEFLFNTDLIFDTPAYVKGLKAKSVEEMTADIVWIHTEAGQKVELLRDEDGVWRIREPIHEAFAARIGTIEGNRAALETAVALFTAPERPTAPADSGEGGEADGEGASDARDD